MHLSPTSKLGYLSFKVTPITNKSSIDCRTWAVALRVQIWVISVPCITNHKGQTGC